MRSGNETKQVRSDNETKIVKSDNKYKIVRSGTETKKELRAEPLKKRLCGRNPPPIHLILNIKHHTHLTGVSFTAQGCTNIL